MSLEKNLKLFRTSHDLIRITGPGAKDFLQGQLSADMDELDNEAAEKEAEGEAGKIFSWRPSLVLGPEGKLVAALRVMHLPEGMLEAQNQAQNQALNQDGDEYVLEVESGFGEKVLQRLNRFSIGANCEMQLDTCLGATLILIKSAKDKSAKVESPKDEASREANENTNLLDGICDTASSTTSLEDSYPIMVQAWNENITCIQILGVSPEVSLGYSTSKSSLEEIPAHPLGELQFYRIICGIPQMGSELYEGLIPAEAGQSFIDSSVSFTKGCFVGQELVARIDSRGAKTPRKLVGLKIMADSIDSLNGNRQLYVDAKEVAEITSLAELPEATDFMSSFGSKVGAVGLAYGKRLLEAGNKVSLKDTQIEAEVCDLPLVLPFAPPQPKEAAERTN